VVFQQYDVSSVVVSQWYLLCCCDFKRNNHMVC
jgi:hypothetical protein